jgi:hypothetical protein
MSQSVAISDDGSVADGSLFAGKIYNQGILTTTYDFSAKRCCFKSSSRLADMVY